MPTRFQITITNPIPTLESDYPNQVSTWFPGRLGDPNMVLRNGDIIVLDDYAALYFKKNYVGEFDAIATTICPQAPSGLAVAAVSSSQVSLIWTGISPAPSYYLIERSFDNSTWADIGTSTTTAFIDMGAVGGTTYYRVRGFDAFSLSSCSAGGDPSNTVTVSVPLAAHVLLLNQGGTLALNMGGSLLINS